MSGAAQRWANWSLSVFDLASLAELGDAVPQTPWDFSLCGLKRQGHAGLGGPSPTCPLPTSRRRSGCVPAKPYPPMEHAKGISPRLGDKRAKQKSAFDRTSAFANYKLSALADYSRPLLLAPRHRILRPDAELQNSTVSAKAKENTHLVEISKARIEGYRQQPKSDWAASAPEIQGETMPCGAASAPGSEPRNRRIPRASPSRVREPTSSLASTRRNPSTHCSSSNTSYSRRSASNRRNPAPRPLASKGPTSRSR